jgi:hypothetical protein
MFTMLRTEDGRKEDTPRPATFLATSATALTLPIRACTLPNELVISVFTPVAEATESNKLPAAPKAVSNKGPNTLQRLELKPRPAKDKIFLIRLLTALNPRVKTPAVALDRIPEAPVDEH